jgi:GntR family transcriptional regulator / MocR family aminotransferase
MALVESILSVNKESCVPVYQQIANGIITHIRRGTLKPESALPGSRMLAESLNVHRKTVVAAYDELYAQSWVDVYPRKGIFIAKNLPDVSPKPINADQHMNAISETTSYDFDDLNVPATRLYKAPAANNIVVNDGFPDTRLAPVDLLMREYRRLANYRFTSKYLMYGPEYGSENLRNELSKFLSETRGLHANPENILITKGAQMGIYLISQVLLSKNDVVIVAEPGYPGANEVFEHAGAKLEFAPVDEFGINLDAVEEICKRRKVKMLYVIPHHHRPTTVTLCAERRMRLLELARQYRFAIIEDDYDYDFHYNSSPILPLASADSYGSVIYVGSFSKTIAPGIRIGFVAAPQKLITRLAKLRKLIDRQGEQLLEEAIANLLKNGDISRHLKKANKIYHERRDLLCSLLQEKLGDKVSFQVPSGGFAIWMEYRNGVDSRVVGEKAAEMGLTINNCGDYFYVDPMQKHSFVRLGFASLNEKEMAEAVDILGRAIEKAVQ